MLFHGTQNLLEFDPNFENAFSLIVSSRGKKNGGTNSAPDDDAFVSATADERCCICIPEEPPTKQSLP